MEPKFIITTVHVPEADFAEPEQPSPQNDFNWKLGHVNVRVQMELTGSGDFSQYMEGDMKHNISKAILMGDIELIGYNQI